MKKSEMRQKKPYNNRLDKQRIDQAKIGIKPFKENRTTRFYN
jgi:hypothetical protein